MGSEHGSGSSKHQTIHPMATTNNGDPPIQDNTLRLSSSSSSSSSLSSSSSSSSHPLELGINEKDVVPGKKIEKDDLMSTTAEWSIMSGASPRAGFSLSEIPRNPESKTLTALPTVSPPVQVMGRPPSGYDLNRIPSSVFANKSGGAAMEWSVASNESLFSIHMGNNSFSREQFANMIKSGELKVPDEWINSSSSLLPSLPLAVVIEAPSDIGRKSNSTVGKDSLENEEACESPKVASKGSVLDDDDEKKKSTAGQFSSNTSDISNGQTMPQADEACACPNASALSDASGQSNRSFAFPLLGGETPMKDPPDKPNPQPETPEATPKAAAAKWFSCISRRPNCC